MKRFKIFLISIVLLTIGSSCEDFLDKSPDMGLSDKDVYKSYETIRGFLDICFTELEQIFGDDNSSDGCPHVGCFSDEMVMIFNKSTVLTLNSGNWLRAKQDETFELGVKGATGIHSAYKAIRIANLVLANYTKVPGMTEEQTNEILGQAHFYRAWFYFQLLKRYGGMPIFDHPFLENGEEKIPRVTYHESHQWMMEDIEAAISMLPETWDDSNTGRPSRIAAMAFKSMAQLYDASPLMQNDLNSTEIREYDKERAKLAAQSAMKVITYINTHPDQYRLMDQSEYKDIFYFTFPPSHQPEHIWYNRAPMAGGLTTVKSLWLYADLAGGTQVAASTYNAPTQNMVDLFEKKGKDGNYYPIEDSRAAYDNQKPWTDRDPRLKNNILVPGEEWGKNSSSKPLYITTFEGGKASEDMKTLKNINNRQQTGYLCKKFLWPEANRYTAQWDKYRVITPYIRVAQVYLDFAEASFEATGSATQKVEECDLSAEDALNIVRKRAGITALTQDRVIAPDVFREALRKERAVELMFENHRWWDIRRWMIAHELFNQTYPIKGIKATPVDPKVAINKMKFTYTVVDVTPEVRNFAMRNYWYPFPKTDVASSNGTLQQNPGW